MIYNEGHLIKNIEPQSHGDVNRKTAANRGQLDSAGETQNNRWEICKCKSLMDTEGQFR